MNPVRIVRLTTGGDGVGRLDDGRAVFVPRTAPGDLVALTTPRLRARYARARVAQVLEPGPGRIAPRCPHYIRDDCGGCQWQHLDLPVQREAKRAIVADALVRIARIDAPVDPVIGDDAAWGYRSRIALTPGPGRRYAGFHPVDQPDRVFALERCELAAPALMTLWEVLRRHLSLLPPDTDQLVLRRDRDQRLHLVVKARGDAAWSRAEELCARLAAAGVSATIWWHPKDGAVRVVAGDSETFPATVFEQVNPALAERLRSLAVEALGAVTGVHVWDLYAGIGETTELLRARGATVESVELDRRAVEFAERRGRAHEGASDDSQRPSRGVVRHVGRVEDLIDAMHSPGAVIANPPRTGLQPEVTDVLLLRRPKRLVYVSCDPATLARDLGRLCQPPNGRFTVITVQPFDLFPQTAHVETVAVLESR